MVERQHRRLALIPHHKRLDHRADSLHLRQNRLNRPVRLHRDDELRPVGRHERDPVPRRDPELEEALRGGVDARVELGKGPALSLEGERLSRSPTPSRALRQEPDRLLVVPVPHDPLPDRSGRMGGVCSSPTRSARAGSRWPRRPVCRMSPPSITTL